jgi:ParB-like chromosome segregation protein Spo0J
MKSADAFVSSQGRLPPKGQRQLEWVPRERLRANPKNARKHSRRQIRRLAAMIRKFGFLNPIIVDGDYTILAGHGRIEAAALEGYSHVPVIRVDHLSDVEKRAYVLADNKIAEEAGWDNDLLALELAELVDLLPAEGLDVTLTGFEAAEADGILSSMAPCTTAAEDAIPSLPRDPVSRRGDLWSLGRHRLSCEDARHAASFARLMGSVCAAAVCCDPPYNLRVREIGGRGRVRHREFAFGSGEMSGPQFRAFLRETLANGVGVSVEGAVHFVCIDWRHVDVLIDVGRELYGGLLNIVVWVKTNPGQGSFYRSQHELICVFRVGQNPHRFGRNRSNVWTYAGVNAFGRGRMDALSVHPTVKPIALVADALLDCTARGEAVLDQFVGSGTTILAAERVGRVAYGLEYDPCYVDVAIKRWQAATKLEAVLEGDGRTFDEIAAERGHQR